MNFFYAHQECNKDCVNTGRNFAVWSYAMRLIVKYVHEIALNMR